MKAEMDNIFAWFFGVISFFLAIFLYQFYTDGEIEHLSCYQIRPGSGSFSSHFYFRPVESCSSDSSVSCLTFELQADDRFHAVDVQSCSDRRPSFDTANDALSTQPENE
ncbi:MAG: hypothetical protein D3906_04350 [Candidatus Electrothrix sp. AUS1_2]|nr:hypothetical protein [Candidatus Electrothrix sp. AUS1_2]